MNIRNHFIVDRAINVFIDIKCVSFVMKLVMMNFSFRIHNVKLYF